MTPDRPTRFPLPCRAPHPGMSLRRRLPITLALCLMALTGPGRAGSQTPSPSRAATVPLARVQVDQWWQGVITVSAHEGKACAETSGGQALPYARQVLLHLGPGAGDRTRGLAWGEMLPTRLERLAVPAMTPRHATPEGLWLAPPDVLALTWLPDRGPLSAGRLGSTANARLAVRQGHLVGHWRERMPSGAARDEQCLWTEAALDLIPVPASRVPDVQRQAQALQEVLDRVAQQQDLPPEQRWQAAALERIASASRAVPSGSMAARSLVPVLSQLGEMLYLAHGPERAAGLLRQAAALVLDLLDQDPARMTPYVTSMTPLLRAVGALHEAEILNQRAVQAMQDHGLGRSAEQARLLSGYGALLLRLRRLGEAQSIYGQALDIERAQSGGRHVGVVIALINLSRACELLGERERSMRLADEASQLHETLGLGPLNAAPLIRKGEGAV